MLRSRSKSNYSIRHGINSNFRYRPDMQPLDQYSFCKPAHRPNSVVSMARGNFALVPKPEIQAGTLPIIPYCVSSGRLRFAAFGQALVLQKNELACTVEAGTTRSEFVVAASFRT